MFRTLRFISGEEATPDHNSKILYMEGKDAPKFGMFTLVWGKHSDSVWDLIDYQEEDPGSEYGLIGLIDGKMVHDEIYWMSVEQFEEVVR